MKKIFLLLAVVAGQAAHAQETFPVNGTSNKNHTTYAFTNARIVVDPETTIENGTLIVKDGLITAVGPKAAVPKGAETVDLKGKTIYPGLIDAYTSYGMPEIKKGPASWGPQMESNIKGAYGWNAAIRADVEAGKIFTGDPKAADELRRLVDKHQSGQSDFSAPLWTLMMFEAFLRQVVDASDSIGLPVPAEALA